MPEELPVVLLLSTARTFRGGERQAAVLLNALSARGFRPAAAAPPGAPLFERLSPEVLRTPLPRRSELSPLNRFELSSLCRRLGVSVLHCNDAHALGRAAWLLGSAARPAVVAHRRMAFPIRSRLKYSKVPDLVVAISRTAARALEEGGVPPSMIRVVYSAVDPFFLAPPPPRTEARSALGWPAGAPVLFYAAAFTPEKGHRLLFDAFRLVRARFPAAVLALAGSGPLEGELRSAAPPGVRFEGSLERERLRLAYRAADVFVFAGAREGLGTAAVEAMACGAPVVAVDRGGVAEVVERGVTGLLAPPEPAPFAEAVVRLAGDETLRLRMGEAGRKRAAGLFAPDAMADALAACYRDVLAGRSGPGGAR